jgi:hypothetical protein
VGTSALASWGFAIPIATTERHDSSSTLKIWRNFFIILMYFIIGLFWALGKGSKQGCFAARALIVTKKYTTIITK